MKLFKISVKFEQNGKWSERQADTEGYFIQRDDQYNTIEGYVKVLYPSNTETRYIKGLYSEDEGLIFIQFAPLFTPICYCFPNGKQNGFWSAFKIDTGFFPIFPGQSCADGHAQIIIEEYPEQDILKVEYTISSAKDSALNDSQINREVAGDYRSLTDFLKVEVIFQMKLHCGKW